MYSKHYLESQLAVALGGRVAEELVYGEDMVTTGAYDDIRHVATIAKRMVKEWGMSDKVGRVVVAEPGGRSPFMGRIMIQRNARWGNKILTAVEEEVERLVNNSYTIAKHILSENLESRRECVPAAGKCLNDDGMLCRGLSNFWAEHSNP